MSKMWSMHTTEYYSALKRKDRVTKWGRSFTRAHKHASIHHRCVWGVAAAAAAIEFTASHWRESQNLPVPAITPAIQAAGALSYPSHSAAPVPHQGRAHHLPQLLRISQTGKQNKRIRKQGFSFLLPSNQPHMSALH